jgi:hypothetical protein
MWIPYLVSNVYAYLYERSIRHIWYVGGAAGDLEGNLFKATSIILSIVYVYILVRKGKPRQVTLASLWHNNPKTNPNLEPTKQNTHLESNYV